MNTSFYYILLAVVDVTDKGQADSLECVIKSNNYDCDAIVAAWTEAHKDDAHEFNEGDVYECLPVYDEIICESDAHVITYSESGLCDSVYMYKKI